MSTPKNPGSQESKLYRYKTSMNLANKSRAPWKRGIVASKSENEKNHRRHVKPKDRELTSISTQKILTSQNLRLLTLNPINNGREE
jgi:hypothetical protein